MHANVNLNPIFTTFDVEREEKKKQPKQQTLIES